MQFSQQIINHQRTTSNCQQQVRRQQKSFNQYMKINSCPAALKVDLSESQLKMSETFSIPLSAKNAQVKSLYPTHQIFNNQNNILPTPTANSMNACQSIDNNSEDVARSVGSQIQSQFQNYNMLDVNIEKYKYGISSRKGNFRKNQEDRFIVEDCFRKNANNAIFAVFDGHSGETASQFCQQKLMTIIEKNSNKFDIDICQALKEVNQQLDEEYLQLARQYNLNDGATSLIATIIDNKLTVSNLGDSSAILVRSDQCLELSSEQTPLRIDEYQRIIEQNGFIVPVGQTMRVQGVLAVTRAIGDLQYKDVIISEPEISSITMSPQDQFLIISTDGLYRIYSKQRIADYVVKMSKQGYTLGTIASLITQKAVEDGCPDNMTIIIVDLQAYHSKFLNQRLVQNAYQSQEFTDFEWIRRLSQKENVNINRLRRNCNSSPQKQLTQQYQQTVQNSQQQFQAPCSKQPSFKRSADSMNDPSKQQTIARSIDRNQDKLQSNFILSPQQHQQNQHIPMCKDDQSMKSEEQNQVSSLFDIKRAIQQQKDRLQLPSLRLPDPIFDDQDKSPSMDTQDLN
eukprot:403342169